MNTALIRFDKMTQAIVACHAVDEVAEIRNRAVAMEKYFRVAKNTDNERKCHEIRLRAERRGGELLMEMRKNGGRAGRGQPKEMSSDATLSDLGLTRDEASKWQQLAAVPDHVFESAVRDPLERPSLSGIVRKAKGEPVKRMDPDALWIWGRLRDFERDRLTDREPAELFNAMTETMQDDILRLLPSIIPWLKILGAQRRKVN